MVRRPSATTLFLYPASNSPLALVIRRGPSKCWHFLLWNRKDHSVTPGSWFNGMIYPNRCDLSPRGDLMIILAYRGGGDPVAWTALCRPPSVKAVAFWPQRSGRVGGGYFDGRLPVAWINMNAVGHEPPELREPLPVEFGYQEEEGTMFGRLGERLERDGWKPAPAPKAEATPTPVYHKRSPKRTYQLILEVSDGIDLEKNDLATLQSPSTRYSLRRGQEEPVPIGIPGLSWADWAPSGELCLASEGRLLKAQPSNPAETLEVVADLNGLEPRQRTGNTTEEPGEESDKP